MTPFLFLPVISGHAFPLSRVNVYSADPNRPNRTVVQMPQNPPRRLIIPEFEGGPPRGVYESVLSDIYFYLYYTSMPASDVQDFEAQKSLKKFSVGDKSVRIQPFKFGSLVVDEALYTKDLANLQCSVENMTFLREGTLIPIDILPEIYINESIHLQLKKCLGEEYKVMTQTAGSVLPYNIFYESRPDIVIEHVTKDDGTIVADLSDSDIPEEESQSDSDSVSGDEELCVTEMGKKTGGLPQLYAEAFNVAVARFAQKCVRERRDLTSISVYCILLSEKCKKGTLSQLTIDFGKQTCKIVEDSTLYESHQCFNIALKRNT